MKTKLTDFRATAKAWLAAAAAGIATVSAYVVPDSTVGRVLLSAGAFVAALLAVFNVENKPAEPAQSDSYLG